ncbi:MAG TPA: hypothetical protein VE093_25060 [Polyangiaceae bacterium]|jgi:hypothetical protein|nr:hypothetical protein [Polyangiaceae bacterium]
MSAQKRAGIRAARALLSLLEENSAEDFEAAESILGSETELANILRLLRKFKEHKEETPLIERLRGIIRKELVHLSVPPSLLATVADQILGIKIRTPPGASVEDVADGLFRDIEAQNFSPSAQVDALTAVLVEIFAICSGEPEEKLASLLRDIAIPALTENTAMIPSLNALAELRTRWAHKPLPYQPKESRQHLATRLFDDALRIQPNNYLQITRDLLREGLRSPADAAIAAVRRMRSKKANGE